ncbi:glycosyltransferase family 2 protein [Ramlibacter rhizophilus]|uniref:Glycosyltransferase family 2 protein n=1 Tax=Ramlibacter rhizophilus TaxID=1781167 RepID=A0A4Z0BHC6_9BURK|nr:glycosyltransferase family A protein [Ramlibacter rhizophilus]TFY98702.1 glycosyltransferase family 2 protein [Ramlibacter rhizophilus]
MTHDTTAPLVPGFTVVMPLYNKGRYVQEAVRSVLRQATPVSEVIVVDDGSADDGPSQVESLRDPRVRLVRQLNAGVAKARNRGIDLASSEWVAFLDADDLQHPRLFSELQRAHEAHPDAQVLTAGFLQVPEAFVADRVDWPLDQRPPIERIDNLRRRWMRSRLFCIGTVAVQTRLLRQMQPCFFPGESHGEDLDLWFRLSDRTPIAHVHAPLAAYRRNASASLSARRSGVMVPGFIARMRESALAGRVPARYTTSALWFVAQQEIGIAREYLAAGDRRAALHLLGRSAHHGFGLRWLRTVAMLCVPVRDPTIPFAAPDKLPGD